MSNALVLSGGSIRGAFQVGAIVELFNAGFRPDGIYGISVGSINGAFLADRAGQAGGENLDWAAIGRKLEQFWLTHIDSFDKIGRKRSKTKLGRAILSNKFEGLLDMTRLKRLIRNTLDIGNLRNCPVIFKAGSVNIADGTLIQADITYPNLIDYVVASAAIPILMKIVEINQRPLVDGGLRDMAPIKEAIDDGMTKIVCVVCQSENISGVDIDLGNILQLAERYIDIVINEIVKNDIDWAEYVNRFCPQDSDRLTSGSGVIPKPVDLTVIRPLISPAVDLTGFTQKDIEDLIEQGKLAARRELAKKPLPDSV